MCDNDIEYGEQIDPRVQIELERLNNATDKINKLELDLDEARATFRNLLCESTARVDALRLKLGVCVEKCKPYYEARFHANEALKQTQIAAMRYERANSAHSAAREMVYLAEQGLGGRTLDPAWQEMLNHATQRVNDAERERGMAGSEHRAACITHEGASSKVALLQKDLKRAIAKSSLSIRRALMQISSIAYRHQLMLLPYYEMKAQFNHMLEIQKQKVQNFEAQVSHAKLTYADALRNLEQISDEIHRTRNKMSKSMASGATTENGTTSSSSTTSSNGKETSANNNKHGMKLSDTIGSFPDIPFNQDEYKSLPATLGPLASPIKAKNLEKVEGYRNISPSSQDEKQTIASSITRSHSSEWTEINLDVSSPEDEEDIPYQRLEQQRQQQKPQLLKQKTLPNPQIEHEFAQCSPPPKSSSSSVVKTKLDSSIANWISRSSAKAEQEASVNQNRRQSLDNILGPTSEKVKEIFSHGMMMLNISSLTERRNSEPRTALPDEKNGGTNPVVNGKGSGGGGKKIPSPLEKTLTYLTADEDTSDCESLASVDMLTEDQINSLMMDKNLDKVCIEVLGTPLTEVCPFPMDAVNGTNNNSNSTKASQMNN